MRILKVFQTSLFLLSFSSLAVAGSISESMVPSAVKSTFAQTFPTAQVIEWDFEDDDNAYEVEGRIGEREIKALIAEDGKLIRSKEDVWAQDVPAAILKQVEKKWPRAQVLGANKITTSKGVVWDVGLKFRNRHHNVKIAE